MSRAHSHSFVARALVRMGWKHPPEYSSIAQLRAGPCQLSGSLGCAALMESPIEGTPCAGFHYRATFMSTRARGQRRRVLRTVTAFAAALELELDDGLVNLLPPRSEELEPDGHRALAEHGFPGFDATEALLMPGQRVRVVGTARRDRDDAWLISATQLYRLG